MKIETDRSYALAHLRREGFEEADDEEISDLGVWKRGEERIVIQQGTNTGYVIGTYILREEDKHGKS
jgi:hypothetical protein|tara:strand:- start:703 stop:903 length:201 start_codon:yes stop_codon:yes gene_type:complete